MPVSLGADGPPCNNNLDALVEMRLAALLQKPHHGPTSMPAQRVLRLATRDGAKALGIDNLVGSLEVGKRADIVALFLEDDPGTGPGGSPYSRIVYSAGRRHIRHVFASGDQVVEGGELTKMDVGRVIASAKTALDTTLERMLAFLPS